MPMPSPVSTEVTRLLEDVQAGRVDADVLIPVVYDELRRVAQRQLSEERPGQTLQATALVHEAYLRLLGGTSPGWDHRGHFFAAAAEAMRRILIEAARRKARIKHGGGKQRVDLQTGDAILVDSKHDVLSIDESLTRFEAIDPKKAELVKLRYFAGLTEPEAARALGISRATASRWWTFAKAWLYADLRRAQDSSFRNV